MSTLTKQGYTDAYVVPDSSVIDTAYYDEQTQRLYVALHNGTRVGYADFTPFSWRTFKNYDSAGSFWNRYIKGAYRGLDGDVELYDRKIERPETVNSAALTQAHTAFTAFKDIKAEGTGTSPFHVLVKVDATSVASAAGLFDKYDVVSVTRL